MSDVLRSVQTTSGPISAPLQGCSRWVWRDPLSGAGSLCGAAAARLDRSMELFCRLPAEEPRWCRRHHRFRSHLMVPASAISFPEVRRLELIEHGFMSQIDICGVLDSCSQAQIREESSVTARNYPARPCQPYEEAHLRWGLGSFCDSAQLHACASAPACAHRWCAVCTRSSSILALSLHLRHDPRGYGHLRVVLHNTTSGLMGGGGRGEARL